MSLTLHDEYYLVADRIRRAVLSRFTNGCRVRYANTRTSQWIGTVRHLTGRFADQLSPDHVFVDWDNGNKYPVKYTEIHEAT